MTQTNPPHRATTQLAENASRARRRADAGGGEPVAAELGRDARRAGGRVHWAA